MLTCKAVVEKVTGGMKRGEYWRIAIYAKRGKKNRWYLVDTISGFDTEASAGLALAELVRSVTDADRPRMVTTKTIDCSTPDPEAPC